MNWEKLNYLNEKMTVAMSHIFMHNSAHYDNKILEEGLLHKLKDAIDNNKASVEDFIEYIYDNWGKTHPFEVIIRLIVAAENIIHNNETVDNIKEALQSKSKAAYEASTSLLDLWHKNYTVPTLFDNLFHKFLDTPHDKDLNAELHYTKGKAVCLTSMINLGEKFIHQVNLISSEPIASMKKGYLELSNDYLKQFQKLNSNCKEKYGEHTIIDKELYPLLNEMISDLNKSHTELQLLSLDFLGANDNLEIV